MYRQKKFLDGLLQRELALYKTEKWNTNWEVNVPLSIGYGEEFTPTIADITLKAQLEIIKFGTTIWTKRQDYRLFYKRGINGALHRSLMHDETVFEIDDGTEEDSIESGKKLLLALDSLKNIGFDLYSQYWICSHSGRSIHLHFISCNEKAQNSLREVIVGLFPSVDRCVLFGRPNKKLIRCEGSQYKNKTYKSCFKTFDDIKPIYKRYNVNYPKIKNVI